MARDDLGHPAAERRRRAEKEIAAFAAEAAERCERLRQQLRGAEDLARHLQQCLPAAARPGA